MSGQTINQSATRIEALQLQSSAYGVTLALAFGRCRLPGNLLWYGGFKAVPHTQTQSGKGGGVKVQNTTYTYRASVMMGICEGPVLEVPRIWRGKNLYSGGYAPTQLLHTRETFTVPGSRTYDLVHGARLLGRVTALLPDADPSRGGNRLSEGLDFTVTGGTVTFAEHMTGRRVTVAYQYATGGQPQTAMQQLGLSLLPGHVGQPVWSHLATQAPAQAIPYSGIAAVAGQDYDLGTGAQVENHTFEVIAPLAYTVAAGVPDADPADFTPEVLCNARFGALFPPERLAGLDAWSDYCRAAGLLMSPVLTEQMSAADFVATACKLTNSWPVWSDGVLKIRPLGDTPLAANGRSYSPDNTPVYDLTDDHFLLDSPDAERVTITRRGQADVHNHLRLEWRNRANQYSLEIAEAKDRAHIQAYGPRSADIIRAHWICDADVAQRVVQLLLQRSIAVRNEYRFTLPWTKALLERGDLVTLTETVQGLEHLPVRITAVNERPDGELDVQAEDFPLGAATAARYANAAGLGYAADYNVAPGSIDPPVIFEAPADLTAKGYEPRPKQPANNTLHQAEKVPATSRRMICAAVPCPGTVTKTQVAKLSSRPRRTARSSSLIRAAWG
jgi:hypothetical protein